MKKVSKETEQKFAVHNVMHSPNQNWRKCGGCGKFISYDEMQNSAICKYTPDTDFTAENVKWFHKYCY